MLFLDSDMASSANIDVPRTDAYSARLSKGFLQLLTHGELTNFKILSGDQSFPCHKSITSSMSPFIKAMLTSNMTEATSGQVQLDDIPPDVVKLLLKYIYTGEATIPSDLLLATVKGSDFLGLLELKDYCLDQALTQIKPSNVIGWHKFGSSQNHEGLTAKCSEILYSAFDEVAISKEFLEITYEEITSYIKDL